MTKFIKIIMAVITLMALACASAFAQVAIVSATSPNQDTNASFNGTTLMLTVGGGNYSSNGDFGQGPGGGSNVASVITFANMSQASYQAPTAANGQTLKTTFTGGAFSITQKGTGTVLLSGTYTSASITSVNGAGSGAVRFTGVTYTAGQPFDVPGMDFTNANGLNEIVASFDTTNGTLIQDNGFGTSMASFQGHDGITYKTSFTGVPEPASFATFGVGAVLMLGLAVMARRRKLTASL